MAIDGGDGPVLAPDALSSRPTQHIAGSGQASSILSNQGTAADAVYTSSPPIADAGSHPKTGEVQVKGSVNLKPADGTTISDNASDAAAEPYVNGISHAQDIEESIAPPPASVPNTDDLLRTAEAEPEVGPPADTSAVTEDIGHPAEEVEASTAADAPHASTNTAGVQESTTSTKVAREREDDHDTDQPASKRTKTDEDVPGSITPQEDTSADPMATAAPATSPDNSDTTQSLSTKQYWGEMTDSQQKRLLEGMRSLKKGKHASSFSKPVDPVAMNLPTYFDVVEKPMDLTTMEQKLKGKEYSSVTDYVADFDLMVSNAIKFNGQQHTVAQSGMMIRSQLEAQLRKLPKPGDTTPGPPPKSKRTSLPGPSREKQRRDSRQSLGAAPAASPVTSFAPDANGVPLARRDSNVIDRPKRKIQRPPPRDLQYPKPQKKKYKAELKFAEEVLTEMERPRYRSVCSAAFMHPVDPVALNIPNYNQIIKEPMDVSTIRQKLSEQQYENLKEFESDFRLMFLNCYKFNPEGHPVNAMGHQFEQIFDEQMAKKRDRLKALAPQSARESPDDEDEDEEEEDADESDDDSNDQQKQLAALNEQLRLLSEQASKLMSQGAGKPGKSGKDKKTKGGKAESNSKKKASGFGPAPLPKEKKSKPKSKPKTKPLTQKEKEEISNRIFELPTEEINVVADKIKKSMRDRGLDVPDESEMEFNIDDIPDAILHDILMRLRRNGGGGGDGNATSKIEDDEYRSPEARTYAPKNKRNKPMSRTDTANQMAAIQQQINSFNGGNAGSPPAKMETSDDDESSAESEEE